VRLHRLTESPHRNTKQHNIFEQELPRQRREHRHRAGEPADDTGRGEQKAQRPTEQHDRHCAADRRQPRRYRSSDDQYRGDARSNQLLSNVTSAAVDSAFNTLAQTVLVQNARTLEDLVREMLRPMLKAWLDDNLPGMVERLVRAEIERVSRGRMG